MALPPGEQCRAMERQSLRGSPDPSPLLPTLLSFWEQRRGFGWGTGRKVRIWVRWDLTEPGISILYPEESGEVGEEGGGLEDVSLLSSH